MKRLGPRACIGWSRGSGNHGGGQAWWEVLARSMETQVWHPPAPALGGGAPQRNNGIFLCAPPGREPPTAAPAPPTPRCLTLVLELHPALGLRARVRQGASPSSEAPGTPAALCTQTSPPPGCHGRPGIMETLLPLVLGRGAGCGPLAPQWDPRS